MDGDPSSQEMSLGRGAKKPYKQLVLCTYSCDKCGQHKSLIVCGLKRVLFDDYSSIFG